MRLIARPARRLAIILESQSPALEVGELAAFLTQVPRQVFAAQLRGFCQQPSLLLDGPLVLDALLGGHQRKATRRRTPRAAD